MRERPFLVLFVAPAAAFLLALAGITTLVARPSALGWAGFGVLATIGLAAALAASLLVSRGRTNAERVHPRGGAIFRLLVVADAHCDRNALSETARRLISDRPSELYVVAPVLASPLHFLADDEEHERDDARARLAETLQGLSELGADVRGMLGSDDPLQAIGDALVVFPADEILLALPGHGRSWVERDLGRKARDLFGVHVSTATFDATVSQPTRPG